VAETWDRSHQWVLHCYHHKQVKVTATMDGPHLVPQLMAARQIWEKFQTMLPAQVRERIVNGRLPLGVVSTTEWWRMREKAATLGLKLEAEGTSTVTYLPEDKTAGAAWHIDSEAEMLKIAKEMMAAGVPVVVSEVD